MLSCLGDGAYKSSLDANRKKIGPDGAVAKSSDNGLAGKGFVSRYKLQPRAGS